jgi:hypothetical protein
VLPGEIAISNAAGTVTKWRSTTSNSTITWSLIDTGSEETSTSYNLFATADTDVTGMVFSVSKSSAPSGSTYYRKIATFYNDASGNITDVKSLRPDDGTDFPDVAKGWISFNGTSTIAINDEYNVSGIVDNGEGDYTITWDTAFANANYAISLTCEDASGNELVMIAPKTSGITTTSVRINIKNGVDGSAADSPSIHLIAFGDRV